MNLRSVGSWPLAPRVAWAALIAALLLDGILLVRAAVFRATIATYTSHIRDSEPLPVRLRSDPELLHEALLRDPFDPGASPSLASPAAVSLMQAASPVSTGVAAPRLLGTVVDSGTGGFVVLELPTGQIRLVRLGERVEELRLTSVSAGRADFRDRTGARVTLRSAAPGPDSRP